MIDNDDNSDTGGMNDMISRSTNIYYISNIMIFHICWSYMMKY
jgi:hypothetical protein